MPAFPHGVAGAGHPFWDLAGSGPLGVALGAMGWVGPRVRRPAIKALVLASDFIVGQVAQFGNWAYSAKRNKRHPRPPSDTGEKQLKRHAM